MSNCTKCGKMFFCNKLVIEGKTHYLSSRGRKRCFDCSPFRIHNQNKGNNKCQCGKYFLSNVHSNCPSCRYKKSRNKRITSVYNWIGTACWFCGYDKGISGVSVLDFHHMNPAEKLFNLSCRELAFKKMDKILEEVQKCSLLCCRCHREVHCGIINEKEISKIYTEKWNALDVNDMLTGPKQRPTKNCLCCEKQFYSKTKANKFCSAECSSKAQRKVDRPSSQELLEEISKSNYVKTALKYGVSDNTIRKWIKAIEPAFSEIS